MRLLTALLVLALSGCPAPEPTVTDLDGDGWSPDAGDCDDTDVLVNPDAEEICNEVDDDCDDLIDQQDPGLLDGVTVWVDSDGDGFGDEDTALSLCDPTGWADNSDDCDDNDSHIYPGADEVCDDIDNDCDGDIDGDDDSLTDGQSLYTDADEDGFGAGDAELACLGDGWSEVDTDCDDTDDAINPDADEICDDVDNDCDDLIDGQDDAVIDAPTWYPDSDGDGFGAEDDGEVSCGGFADWVTTGEDCNDGDETIHPDADEICDGLDNDCDDLIDGQDEDVAATTWYHDGDGDGYGDPKDTLTACNQPGGYVGNSDDCDDTDNTVQTCAL